MSHGPASFDNNPAHYVGGERFAKFSRIALAIGGGGLLLACWLGFRSEDPAHFARVYLLNFIFVLSLGLGSLLFVMIQRLTRAGWSAALRRPAELIAANLQWWWIMFLPFVVLWLAGSKGDGHGMTLASIWPWADLHALAEHNPAEAHVLESKSGYLNTNFFFIRAAIYFGLWAILARTMLVNSLRQDSADSDTARAIDVRLQKWSAFGVISFGLTITFAAFDWMMSLSPAWFSTMFGVYFFAAICAGGYSFLALIVLRLRQLGLLSAVVTSEHLQDLGKMIFAFGVVFWAYIAFSQYMLIWYASIPEETTWFLARQIGGWGPLSFALIIGHFVIPFVFLISRWVKRWPVSLAVGALWMLAFHWIDLYWLIMPVIPPDVGSYSTYGALAEAYSATPTRLGDPLNYLMLVGMLGLFAAVSLRRLSKRPALAVHDPRLPESLRFQNI